MIMEKQNNPTISIDGNALYIELACDLNAHEMERVYGAGVKALEASIVSVVAINLSGKNIFSSHTRKKLARFLENPNIMRAAVIVDGVVMKTTASFVIAQSCADNIKYFESNNEALLWLKEG